MRVYDFRMKEVINVSDGRRLGYVADIEFDEEKGVIESLIIPEGGKVFGMFGKESEFVVPWENIKRIGEDIVIVALDKRQIQRLRKTAD